MIMIVSTYNLKGYKIPAASKDSKKAYENQSIGGASLLTPVLTYLQKERFEKNVFHDFD